MKMLSTPDTAAEEKMDLLQCISLVLSIYVLIALLLQTFCAIPPETAALLDKIDFVICFFFLYDFFHRLYLAESKLQFLKWGWIDFVSSIPVYGTFQLARITRVIRLVRVLRAFRSTKILVQFLYRNRSKSTLATAALIAFLMMIFSAIAILNLETSPKSNIKNPEDALWWAFATVTTDGYGDRYPVTTGGRVIAAILMTSSMGLVGIFTGFITSHFVNHEQGSSKSDIKILVDEVKMLRSELQDMRAEMSRIGMKNELDHL